MKGLWPYLAAPLVGAIAVGGFYPFEIWILPILSLFLILLITDGKRFSQRLSIFYLYGLGFLAPLLHWSSTYVGSMPWLILSSGFASFYTLLAFGFRRNRVQPMAFALTMGLSEGLRALYPFGGFGWGRFGFSQLGGPLQEWLRIGGVSLTSVLVALVAALLVKRNRSSLLVIPIIVMSIFALSPARASDDAPLGSVTRIGLIQGGVSQLGLSFNATPQEVFDRHLQVTRRLLANSSVDFILWPENASDLDPTRDENLKRSLNDLSREASTPLIIGAVTQGEEGPENVSLMFDGSDAIVSRYQKRDLVPFGEYIPIRNIASFLSPLADTIRDFIAGDEIRTHRVQNHEFAPLICYEVLDDRVAYENLSRSTLGVVQTNNATFGRSWQSGQQFQITRVRAFESQVPFVVAATTGDTALIGGDGEVKERLTKYEAASLIVEVAPTAPRIPPVSPEAMLYISSLFFLFLRHPRWYFDKAISRRDMRK